MVVNPYQKAWKDLTDEQRAQRRANAKSCRLRMIEKAKEDPELAEKLQQKRERMRERQQEHYYAHRDEQLAKANLRYRQSQCIRPFPICY